LFCDGLHGAVVTDAVDIAQHADMRIGVVPVVNLEWIQKIHRDRLTRGYSTEAVIDTILRRMPDYVTYICPQFTQTHINFQRVPTVDTSNPFIARWIPTPDESMIVIRFANPRGIDFPYLLSMIDSSFMSRADSIVIPGGKLDIAMQLILAPIILQLLEKKRRAAEVFRSRETWTQPSVCEARRSGQLSYLGVPYLKRGYLIPQIDRHRRRFTRSPSSLGPMGT
jgi:phosphoribulokinase